MGPLLREYAEKFRRIREEARQLRDPKGAGPFSPQEFSAMQHGFHGLHNAARQAAEEVSQRIDHSDFEDVEQIELKLRLAELEFELDATMATILL